MQPDKYIFFKPYPFSPEYKMQLNFLRYSENDRLALQLNYYDSDFKSFAPYAMLTVNIPDFKLSSQDAVLLDTNNCPWVERLLVETLHVAEPTNRYAHTVFCSYPEVKLLPYIIYQYIHFKE